MSNIEALNLSYLYKKCGIKWMFEMEFEMSLTRVLTLTVHAIQTHLYCNMFLGLFKKANYKSSPPRNENRIVLHTDLSISLQCVTFFQFTDLNTVFIMTVIVIY